MWKLADAKGIRSPGRDIYSVNFADCLPEALKRDAKMKALAAAVTKQMLGVSAEIDNALIYSRFDELPEELVDILAYDMHVDWYDYSYPLDVKREIVKNSVKVHKKLGTKYAVETALKSVYKHVRISEWFEYGGSPYFFNINVDVSGSGFSQRAYRDILDKVRFYKNLRSHCDGVYVSLKGCDAAVGALAGCGVGVALKVKARAAGCIEAREVLQAMTDGALGAAMKVKARRADKIEAKETLSAMAGGAVAGALKVKPAIMGNVRGNVATNAFAEIKRSGGLKVKAKEPGRSNGGTAAEQKAESGLTVKGGV